MTGRAAPRKWGARHHRLVGSLMSGWLRRSGLTWRAAAALCHWVVFPRMNCRSISRGVLREFGATRMQQPRIHDERVAGVSGDLFDPDLFLFHDATRAEQPLGPVGFVAAGQQIPEPGVVVGESSSHVSGAEPCIAATDTREPVGPGATSVPPPRDRTGDRQANTTSRGSPARPLESICQPETGSRHGTPGWGNVTSGRPQCLGGSQPGLTSSASTAPQTCAVAIASKARYGRAPESAQVSRRPRSGFAPPPRPAAAAGTARGGPASRLNTSRWAGGPGHCGPVLS
jgi:hypothetical protein